MPARGESATGAGAVGEKGGLTAPARRVLAVDPDPRGGTWVRVAGSGHVEAHGWRDTMAGLRVAALGGIDEVVVEGVQSYGMPVGETVFATVKNIGELRGFCRGGLASFDDTLTRPQIKSALCRSAKATDANVNRALYDLYGDGTRKSCVGTKASPGSLYGFKADVWAALALAVVWLSRRGLGPLAARDGIAGEAA